MKTVTFTSHPDQRVTSYEYNAYGELTKATAPDPDTLGGTNRPTTSTTYFATGQVKTVTDPVGAVTGYSYNDLGQLTEATLPDPDGAGSLVSPITRYQYLCMCQLGSVDVVGFFFRTGTEKRVGGAGGGASSPCSPARGGRNRARLQAVGAHAWQDAPARKVEAGGLPSRSDYAARLGGGFALSC